MENTKNKDSDSSDYKTDNKKKERKKSFKKWWENTLLYTAIGLFKGIRKI